MSAPIIKWVGGKRQLLHELVPRLPVDFGRYYEPFVGGAALFFELHRTGRLHLGATLSDVNPDLVTMYRAVRDDVQGVIRELKRHPYESEHYYAVRALDPEKMSDVERAARFIYINKAGFNGLWRVNKSGKCNVPFGRHVNPTICDESRLLAASMALHGVTVRLDDFAVVELDAKPGDLVYFDPPYVPVSETASFTSYASGGFGPDDQRRLADLVRRLASRGVHVVVSNSDAPFVHELYAEHRIDVVYATRSVNCNGGKRGRVGEVIVTTARHAMADRLAPVRAEQGVLL